MAQFQLTATSDINRCNGFHMDKGTTININIHMAGITPYNLFNNSRCQEALIQQFKLNGIDLPRTDAVFSRGYWDIKMM